MESNRERYQQRFYFPRDFGILFCADESCYDRDNPQWVQRERVISKIRSATCALQGIAEPLVRCPFAASWCLTFKNPPAADHRAFDGDLHQRQRIFVQRVTTEHNQISKLALLDRAFLVFFERRVGTVDRLCAQRFVNCDALLRSPDVPI